MIPVVRALPRITWTFRARILSCRRWRDCRSSTRCSILRENRWCACYGATPSSHHSNCTENGRKCHRFNSLIEWLAPLSSCKDRSCKRRLSRGKCPRSCLKTGSRSEPLNRSWTFQFLKFSRKSSRFSKVFVQDRVQQRMVEQITETPSSFP